MPGYAGHPSGRCRGESEGRAALAGASRPLSDFVSSLRAGAPAGKGAGVVAKTDAARLREGKPGRTGREGLARRTAVRRGETRNAALFSAAAGTQ